MLFEKYFERWRVMLLFMTGVCVLIYFIVFRPLSNNVSQLEKNLNKQKSKIVLNSRFGYSASDIRQSYFSARSENRQLNELIDKFSDLFRYPKQINDKLEADFQNTEYELYRYNLISTYSSEADKKKISISANLDEGFPAFSGQKEYQQLLWAHLETMRYVFDLLYRLGGIEILALESLPITTTNASNDDQGLWFKLPLKIKVSGDGGKVMEFLRWIPLTDGELFSRYDMDVPGKPALILDSVLVRRVDAVPSKVMLDTTIHGFLSNTNALPDLQE